MSDSPVVSYERWLKALANESFPYAELVLPAEKLTRGKVFAVVDTSAKYTVHFFKRRAEALNFQAEIGSPHQIVEYSFGPGFCGSMKLAA